MKQTRAALIANAAWIATTVWIGLIILRALIVAEGNPVVVVGILSGPNLIGAATAAAATILTTLLSAAVGIAVLLAIFGRYLGLSRIARLALIGGAAVGVLILLAVVPAYAVTVTFVGLIVGLVVLAVDIRRKKRTAAPESGAAGSRTKPAKQKTQAEKDTKDASGFWRPVVFLTSALMALTVLGGSWVQPERIEAHGDVTVGYFVSQDDAWTTFLTRENKHLLILRTDEIDQRDFCDFEVTWAYWLTVPLTRLNDPRLPDCAA